MERFKCAADFYMHLRYTPTIFHMCNDATALRRTLVWRQKDNALLGLNTLADVRCPDTLEALEQLVQQHGMASELDALLLCPLDPMLPSFVLAVFPQQHSVNACVHLLRWAVAEEQLARFGMFVVTHGVDGAAPHLLAEQTRQPRASLPSSCFDSPAQAATTLPPPLDAFHSAPRDKLIWFDVPHIDGVSAPRRVSAPARKVDIAISGATKTVLLPDLHFQDFCHLGSKLRVRLCGRNGHGVTIGNGRAVISLLERAVNAVWEQLLVGIRASDFDPARDPMNLPAFFRLTSDNVLAYLRVQIETRSQEPHAAPTLAARKWLVTELRYIYAQYHAFICDFWLSVCSLLFC